MDVLSRSEGDQRIKHKKTAPELTEAAVIKTYSDLLNAVYGI